MTSWPFFQLRSFIGALLLSFSLHLPTFFLNGAQSAQRNTLSDTVTQIKASLIIKDHATAAQIAAEAYLKYPQSKTLQELYITSLARDGQIQKMLLIWKNYEKSEDSPYENKALLEEMAWGVLYKASSSPTPILRAMASIGAFYGQDQKGVLILNKHLQDHNSLVRLISLKLSSKMRDALLRDTVTRLLQEERVWKVRLAAIQAAGQMKIEALKPALFNILSSPEREAEEKAAAIEALVSLTENIEEKEVRQLAQSDRVGLRLLACEAISYFQLKSAAKELLLLTQDPNSDVRAAALQTLGRLKINDIDGKPVLMLAREMLQDQNPQVAITAAWLLTLYEPSEGERVFFPWIYHQNKETQRAAAAALGAIGKYGVPFMLKIFKSHPDRYIRTNISLALIGQQEAITAACEEIHKNFTIDKERWMWQNFGSFRTLSPQTPCAQERRIEDPEMTDLSTRIDILNILAIKKYEKAQETATYFLDQRPWGISGSASALLLTEGKESAVALVEEMLDHPKSNIRIQAALILAIWGRDEKAVALLQENYKKADRMLKERILEGIGGVGAKSSIPFLVDKLGEPYEALSVIAASALLQCLYH